MDYQHLEVNGYSSFNGLTGSMRHVKYDMDCAVARCRRSFSISWHACRCSRHSFLMAMSRFASMDQFGQVILLQCRVLVQMCRSFHNRSAGLEFVSSCTCKGVLYLRRSRGREEEGADTVGQAGAGSKRLTRPRRKEGGKERGSPLRLMHLKEVIVSTIDRYPA